MNLGFSEPWAFDIPLALSGNVFYDREIRINYDTIQSYGFVIGAGRSKLKWPDSNFKINGSYKLSFERNSIAGTYFSDNKLRIMQEGYLNQISLNIERYDLDMPLFPTKGDRLTITPRIAYGPTDRWFRFFKGTVEYEHYLPLPGKFVLGSRSKFGLITKLGKEVRIGKYDLFTAGGTYSDADIRGYEDWAFGGESTNPENSLALLRQHSNYGTRYLNSRCIWLCLPMRKHLGKFIKMSLVIYIKVSVLVHGLTFRCLV